MSFLSQFFGTLFAPAGANDSSSDAHFTANDTSFQHDNHITEINPATGLPMIDIGDGMGGISGIDVGGSPWCQDMHQDHFSSSNDSMFSHDFGSIFDTGMPSSNAGCGTDWQ